MEVSRFSLSAHLSVRPRHWVWVVWRDGCDETTGTMAFMALMCILR